MNISKEPIMTKEELPEKYPDKYFGEVCIERAEDKGWKIYLLQDFDKIVSLEYAKGFVKDLSEAIEYCEKHK